MTYDMDVRQARGAEIPAYAGMTGTARGGMTGTARGGMTGVGLRSTLSMSFRRVSSFASGVVIPAKAGISHCTVGRTAWTLRHSAGSTSFPRRRESPVARLVASLGLSVIPPGLVIPAKAGSSRCAVERIAWSCRPGSVLQRDRIERKQHLTRRRDVPYHTELTIPPEAGAGRTENITVATHFLLPPPPPPPRRGGGARSIVGTCASGFATDVPRRSRIDRRRLTTLPLWRYDIECEVSHG